MTYLISLDGTLKHTSEEVGGKAYNLNILKKNKFNIPLSYAVPASFFRQKVKNEIDVGNISFDNISQESQRLQEKIKKQNFLNCIKPDLNELIDSTKSITKYAVRSSATVEDSENNSFAGQFDSILNVQSEVSSLVEAMQAVYSSLFSIRAIAYCIANNIEVSDLVMAMVVQEMIVEPDVAGTLFTYNVENNSADEICIQAVKGLGDKVVDGSGDVVTYNARRSSIQDDLSKIINPITQISTLEKLIEIALQVEKVYEGKFQDIEWAIKDGDIFLLQTRPITTVT